MKKKGFTLIELLAVIVILAIIALIATPLVLKYIEKAREGANDASANSVLRAAENYYTQSLLNVNTSYPITLDLKNEDDIKKLGLKGSKPADGIITIDKKGNIYLEAIYGEIIYVKLPNEEKITKNPMVIGDYNEWVTDGNGTITNYNENELDNPSKILEVFYVYIHTTSLYALRNEETEFEYKFDYTKDLYENIKLMEQEFEIDRTNLPIEFNKEIDIIIDFYNTDRALSDTEVFDLFYNNKDKIPYAVDFIDAYLAGGDITQTKAYKFVNVNDTFIVPNYVKHDDGSLEKITSIAENSIASTSSFCPQAIRNKQLIIPYGIENIGANNFHTCLLNNVVFASTVKTIGNHSFAFNKLSSVLLPRALETIGETSFEYNNISGELIIPNNVSFIGWGAFHSTELTQDNCNDSYLCDIVGQKNEINQVIFEEGSKIEIVAANAFKDNPLTTLTIPGSIREIGNFAFDSNTLTSVTIKRAQGSDLSVGYTSFGSANVTYQP